MQDFYDQPMNSHQKKMLKIIQKYYKVIEFKIEKELYEPICIIQLEPEEAEDKFYSMETELDNIGISSRLSRVSRKQVKYSLDLKNFDENQYNQNLYALKLSTTFPRTIIKRKMPEKKKYSYISIIIVAFTILLSAWFYFTKMDAFFGYSNNNMGENILNTCIFGFGMFLMIFTHEMGHKIASNKNNITTAPPILIPGPPPLGILAGYISIKDKMKTRNNLFDISITGILTGFICSFLFIIIGFFFSVRIDTSQYIQLYSNFTGKSLSDSASALSGRLNSYNIIVMTLQRLFFGISPNSTSANFYGTNLPSSLIILHPIAFVGWIGIIMTGLNIIPINYLDGGDIFHAMFPQKWGELVGLIIGAVILYTINSYTLYLALLSSCSAISNLNRQEIDPVDITFPLKKLSQKRFILGILLFCTIILFYPLSKNAIIYGISF